ncbi:MAG TPA: response regulator [Planctomycetaceae bacterium]
MIRVRDNGRGLDVQSLANLFELFYQVNTNLDRSDGGLGVGLALVRSLVEMHGGTVEAASPGLGSGSEFIVRLPRATRSVRVDTNDVRVPVAEKGEPSGLRILVVDDNRDAARSLAMMLQILGHQVSLAHEGQRAVDVALAERPDVILLDIGLPGLNGYEVCRSLRQQGLTSQLIAAITGYGQESDRLLAMEAGFDVHLVKPVSFPTIRQLLTSEATKEATK